MHDLLRVHLTAEDLLKTRFADQPAPLVETGHAVAALQRRDPVFGTCCSSAAARLPRAACPLLELIPPSATAHLAEGLEMVQAEPPLPSSGTNCGAWPPVVQPVAPSARRTGSYSVKAEVKVSAQRDA